MFRLFLALRYVASRPISWVSMVGVWLSVAALLCTVAIMSGFLRELREVIRGTTSDLIVSPYSIATRQGRIPAPSFAAVRRVLQDVAGVAGSSPHLWRPALLLGGEEEEGRPVGFRVVSRDFVQVIGLDPGLEAGVTDFAADVAAVADPSLRVVDPAEPFAAPAADLDDLAVALVGDGLARERGLERGDVVTLVTAPDEATEERVPVRSGRFRIGGAVRTGHFENDRTSVYLPLAEARRFAGTNAEASEICVRAAPGADLDALAAEVRERLKAALLPAEVETWRQRHAVDLSNVENQRSILGFLLFFFVAVACFNVFATLTILVSDKVKDIGVLNAMGAPATGIAGVFVTCAVVMTVCGGLLGCGSGVLLAQNINAVNLAVEALTGERIFRPDIYVFDEIPVEIDGWFVALVFVATLGLAITSAAVPAFRAARMDPIRALRWD